MFRRFVADERQRAIDARGSAASPRKLARKILERRSKQAVAGGEMMIEEREGPLACQRCEPQREARELNRDRVEINAV